MELVPVVCGKVLDYLVAPIVKHFGYLFHYHRNLNNLKTQSDELKDIKTGLQLKVDNVRRNGEIIFPDVKQWLDEVDPAIVEAENFYDEELQKKKKRCWHKSRYMVSRKAKKMTQDVVIVLQQKGKEFRSGIIANPPSPGRPDPRTTTTCVSFGSGELILKEVLETLKDDNINMIGLYGMDSVGMSKLVKDIQRRAKASKQFDEVVIADVSKQFDEVVIRNIQGIIGDLLGLTFTQESVLGRANRLYRRLVDEKKKLIVLVDVRERLDLEAIGIPFGEDDQNKCCKFIVTSLRKRFCEEMNSQKNFKLEAQRQISKATFGLVGGHGGDPWDDQSHTTIRSLIVVFNQNGICSFRIEYDDYGQSSWSKIRDFRPESEHDKTEKIVLKYPDEFLISVSGYYKSGGGYVFLNSLKFQSNKQSFGPFGLETGHPFESKTEVGKIIGFFGKSSQYYLESIGVYYELRGKPAIYERTERYGGPWGEVFDDGTYTTIRKLRIVVDEVIRSIRTEYDDNGRSVWSKVHGSSEGTPLEVKLDYPGEFVISISGCVSTAPEGWIVIASLTIETNRKVYGPFGEERGEHFKFPPNHIGKIVGFHGKAGGCVDSLGAYVEPFPDPNPTTSIGPFGGSGGYSWDDGALFTTIRQIQIQFNQVIESICIEYDKNGLSEWSVCHGDSSSTRPTDLIRLDYPGEFLISMSGTSHLISTQHVISSLTFQSNIRTYGPFGTQSGQPFSTLPSTSGKIVSFYGKSGIYIDCIGVHFESLITS